MEWNNAGPWCAKVFDALSWCEAHQLGGFDFPLLRGLVCFPFRLKTGLKWVTV